MNISVILGHPNPKSFNHAIASTAVSTLRENGHQVAFHDLYAEGFDPALPAGEISRGARLRASVARHCREIAQADGIIIVHPNWWGMPPAVLKGWVDRVLRPDVAYRFLPGDDGSGVPIGLLRAKVAFVFNTSDTPAARERRVFGDPLDTIWRNCIFGLCGVSHVHRRTFATVVTSTSEQRARWLAEVKRSVLKCFPQPHRGRRKPVSRA